MVDEKGNTRWLCLCECGTKKWILAGKLSGNGRKNQSCGCSKNEFISKTMTKHGMEGEPTYRSWRSMKTRCTNKNTPYFHNYGGRGITYCESWEKFENFLADMGVRPDGSWLERKNNDLGYSKENCVWATPKSQGRNRRTNRKITINGETHCISEWSEVSGVPPDTLLKRIEAGWPPEKLIIPARKYGTEL